MFEQTFIESKKTIMTNRGSTTLISFTLQAIVIAVIVILPLMFTQALPTKELTTMLTAPPPPPPPPPASSPVKAVKVVKVNPTAELRTPTSIPKEVKMVHDEPQQAPPSATMAGVPGGVPGGVAGGSVGGVIGGVLSSAPVAVPDKPTPQRVRVSQGVTAGLLVHKVTPQYPPLAKQARIQGSVVLHAVIGKDGKVQNLQLVSGHPMLTQSAIQAVKQWQYKPYYLNGQPVEVDTNITVNFSLAGA
jgi:protein TonB